MSTAAERWAADLAAWAIFEHIVAQAPESPWGFSPAIFRPPLEPGPDTPSRVRAREALPDGGSVLDVGCGGGVAGLALVPPAGRVTGFDPTQELLDLFTGRAAELGVEHEAVRGSWPSDAALVGPADVVVCHHVTYNVPGLAAFAQALTARARVRVVMELTGLHPKSGVNDLWRHFWDVDRPAGPTAEDAVAVLTEGGIDPVVERTARLHRVIDRETRIASVRRYLCLPAERDPEIDALLDDELSPSGGIVTLSWAGTA
ncbi:MAG: class I SAM-dependent methyltransferase [Acidimicrobiales bacterium]